MNGTNKKKNDVKYSVTSAHDIDVDAEGEYRDEMRLYNVNLTSSAAMANENDNTNTNNKGNGASMMAKRRIEDDKYTSNYRLAKTALLILAWVSLGLNLEMIGPTLEDLKIFLGVDYSTISFGIILRNCGYLVVTILLGLVLDRCVCFSELLMSFASFVMALASMLIPVTREYLVAMSYFMAQGVAQAVYDLVGNEMILNLWSGISTSPINAMHAGYGIGAILAVQISKNYIVFSVYDAFLTTKTTNTTADTTNKDAFNITTSISSNTSTNNTTTATTTKLAIVGWEKINLNVPYMFAGLVAMLLALLFLIAQFYENKIRKDFEKNRKQLALLTEDFELNGNSRSSSIQAETAFLSKQSKVGAFMRRLFFVDRVFTSNRVLFYLYAQTALIILVFVFNQGYLTILSRFMLTYLVLGPAKFTIESFVIIQTLFWAFFIFGRFFAAYIAFRMDSLRFFFYVLVTNLAFTSLFMIPLFTHYSVFFWFAISMLGLTNGPTTPTGFMIAKQILDFKSFILSLFVVGLALGGIVFQQITAAFLDRFHPVLGWMGYSNPNSSYVIPHLAFLASFFCFLCFIPVLVLYRRFNK